MYNSINYHIIVNRQKKFKRKYDLFKKKNDICEVDTLLDLCFCPNYKPSNVLKVIRKSIFGDLNILPFYLLEKDRCSYSLPFVIEVLLQNGQFNFNYLNDKNQNILQALLSTNFKYKGETATEIIKVLAKYNCFIDLSKEDYFNKSILDYIMENNLLEENYQSLLKIVPTTYERCNLHLKYNNCIIHKIDKGVSKWKNNSFDETEPLSEKEDKSGKIEQPPKKETKRTKERDENFKILNDKEYPTIPAIGRENEMEELILCLAQKKKCPILVGELGVGKTALVDMLAYMIQNDKVPKFLEDKIIIELNPSKIVAGTKYRGEFEEKLENILTKCVENDFILFIDEIHLIYGAGSCENNPNDMASIIRHYIDRYNLKVIGTTTIDEYNKFFASDSLRRRFDRIDIKEPIDEVLYDIIYQTFENYSLEYNISIDEILNDYPNIIEELIKVTSLKHRTQDDKTNNPDLIIGILDKAFAYARIKDEIKLELEHIEKSVEYCSKIYESAKERFYQNISLRNTENEVSHIKIYK